MYCIMYIVLCIVFCLYSGGAGSVGRLVRGLVGALLCTLYSLSPCFSGALLSRPKQGAKPSKHFRYQRSFSAMLGWSLATWQPAYLPFYLYFCRALETFKYLVREIS